MDLSLTSLRRAASWLLLLALFALVLVLPACGGAKDLCSNDRDCETGQFCDQGRCLSQCASNDECARNEYCDTRRGECRTKPSKRPEPSTKAENINPDSGAGDAGTNDSGPTDNATDKGRVPRCGDGVVDPGEACDGNALKGQTCESQGFKKGSLRCFQCRFDTSQCSNGTPPKCGNGKVEAGEACDKSDLNGRDCKSQGFDKGVLNCNDKCQFDTSACEKSSSNKCGNGQLDNGEQCDGNQLGGRDCKSQGFDKGTLRCNATCRFDTGGCSKNSTTKKSFGQPCSDDKECSSGICSKLNQGDKIGYCNATCSGTKACPASPGGARCVFKAGSVSLCGWVCASGGCPTGLHCVDFSNTRVCSGTKGKPPVPAKCQNNKAENGEDCDGTDLRGQTCQSQGFTKGTLTCNNQCQFDTSGCSTGGTGPTNPKFGKPCTGAGSCGNGLVCVQFSSSLSICTAYCSNLLKCPNSPPGASCRYKLQSGKSICGWATPSGAPPRCGNGTIEGAEECDGTTFATTCKARGFSGGKLKCSSTCKIDTSSCTGTSACQLPPLHCGAACTSIVRFSPDKGTGYVVTHGDRYSWIRRDVMMAVKYASATVSCVYPKTFPLGLGDMSLKGGGTPADVSGRLRHPKGTHIQGNDMDIAYYQTGHFNNWLRSVCPHTIGGRDQYHCTGAPTSLDATKSALFIAKILESNKVRVIGVDGKIGPLLEKELQKLYNNGLITKSIITQFKSSVTWEETDKGRGWFRFHHHHLHVSFN